MQQVVVTRKDLDLLYAAMLENARLREALASIAEQIKEVLK